MHGGAVRGQLQLWWGSEGQPPLIGCQGNSVNLSREAMQEVGHWDSPIALLLRNCYIFVWQLMHVQQHTKHSCNKHTTQIVRNCFYSKIHDWNIYIYRPSNNDTTSSVPNVILINTLYWRHWAFPCPLIGTVRRQQSSTIITQVLWIISSSGIEWSNWNSGNDTGTV